jgi:hypothetical protein
LTSLPLRLSRTISDLPTCWIPFTVMRPESTTSIAV